MNSCKINILGTEYVLSERTQEEDKLLINLDGYCDNSTKEIVVVDIDTIDATIRDKSVYIKKVLRHEIIHAYLYESGLAESATFDDEHFEQLVDWVAIQFPKIEKTFEKLGIAH